MHFLRLVPMLETPHIAETITFYTEKLGFICLGKDEELGWANLSKDGASIMFSLPNAHHDFQQPHFTGSLYFYTDQVDLLWDKLRLSTRVSYEIETFEYGMREFAIYDNNGYLLQFGQSVEVAVKS
ncbi:MAG: VOC family protein [Bacteroidota bacterium]